MSAFKAFHWPDHVIGKRESRQIRQEHNALYNSHAELLEAIRDLLAIANSLGTSLGLDEGGPVLDKARAAISKAEGRT